MKCTASKILYFCSKNSKKKVFSFEFLKLPKNKIQWVLKTIFLLLFTGQLRGGGSRERPQSVYEKKFGPVQQCLLSSPPMTQQRSQQVSIGQATVINLVNNNKNSSSSSPSDVSIPPPLPPRYSNDKIRKTQNEHINIIWQISTDSNCESIANFFEFLNFYHLLFALETIGIS